MLVEEVRQLCSMFVSSDSVTGSRISLMWSNCRFSKRPNIGQNLRET